MDKRFALAGKGLWFLFLSVILTLAGAVVVVIPILGWIACPLLMIAGLVLQFMGPYVARTAHPNFQNAFYVSVVALVLGIVAAFVPEKGFLAGLVSILGDVLGFVITYLICTAAGELLAEKGDAEQAARADLIWKLSAGCALVSILCTLTAWIPLLGAVVDIAGVVAGIVSFVTGILEIIFYYKAANSLRAA